VEKYIQKQKSAWTLAGHNVGQGFLPMMCCWKVFFKQQQLLWCCAGPAGPFCPDMCSMGDGTAF